MQIHRRQWGRKEPVLFVGDVRDLASGVSTSEYIPRDWFGSRLFGFAKFASIPVELETVLLLTAGLSAGLAVVNMLPIYGLDGYHVVDSIVRVIVGKRWESRKISRLVNIISWVALAVALLTVFCSLAQSL
jgi:Zn-dependent protease